jgi:hypothetical protein
MVTARPAAVNTAAAGRIRDILLSLPAHSAL